MGARMGKIIMAEGDKERRKVLIVDDEMDMRIFLNALFEMNGFSPVVTRDGREGLAKAKALLPDLIVLDVMMPGEGGAIMYKALKTDDKLRDIPVIVLSGVKEASFRHYLKMMKPGGGIDLPVPSVYMEKPPEPEYLIRTAEKLLA